MWRLEVAALKTISALWTLLFVLSTYAVSSCGFRPVYSPTGANEAPTSDRLAAIRIDPLQGKAGQQLHNFLRDRLNPRGQPVSPDYRLEVLLSSTTRVLAYRSDETGTLAALSLSSRFTLRSVQDNRALYSGRVSVSTSYNILDEQYPTYIAASDALERGLRELSEDIKLRLAIYFSSVDGQDL